MIHIKLKGISAELVLGTYMPKDATIFNNWEEFYHFNDLMHSSKLLMEHIDEMEVLENNTMVFKGRIPLNQISAQKSLAPALQQRTLYLRTECVENAVYEAEIDDREFDIRKLKFETQDYDALFKTSNAFLSQLTYDGKVVNIQWLSGKPVGNLCVLCRFENGYLVPLYDAIKKVHSGR